MNDLVVEARRILDSAVSEHNPRAMFALYSGGDDSICALHLAAQHPAFTAAVLIDTGIAAEETHAHARRVCEMLGVTLLVYKSPESYENIVMKYGFPGPASHRYMYVLLKERAVMQLVRDYKQVKTDRVMLVTGVRQQESRRRMVNVAGPVTRTGARVWVAPLWKWGTLEKEMYLQEQALPLNPIKKMMHISGDCFCGAFAEKGEREMLRLFLPRLYKRICALEEKVIPTFPWRWDEQPPSWWGQVRAGQATLSEEFMPLCWSCSRGGAITGARE